MAGYIFSRRRLTYKNKKGATVARSALYKSVLISLCLCALCEQQLLPTQHHALLLVQVAEVWVVQVINEADGLTCTLHLRA